MCAGLQELRLFSVRSLIFSGYQETAPYGVRLLRTGQKPCCLQSKGRLTGGLCPAVQSGRGLLYPETGHMSRVLLSAASKRL